MCECNKQVEDETNPEASTTVNCETIAKIEDTSKEECTQKKMMKETENSFQQFIALAVVMFIFFGIHNLLQEAMVNVPGFNYSVMLGYMEVLGVTICSFLERRFLKKETKRIAPLKAYPFIAFCLLTSTALSNMSLKYINYPTKVLFRSCKLIPTMILSTFINKRSFSSPEYVCALAVCTGLICFGAADWKLSPSFNPIGLIMVIVSVFGDSILPNLQENLFSHGSSRLEVTFFTNFFTLVAMTISTYLSGDLVDIIKHAMRDDELAFYMTVYIAISYFAISSFMLIIKRYGAVVGVLLGTARKAMTLILSFLFFPKEFSWFHVIGGSLVLAGLLVSSLIKHKIKVQSKAEEGKKLNDIEMQSFNPVNCQRPTIPITK